MAFEIPSPIGTVSPYKSPIDIYKSPTTVPTTSPIGSGPTSPIPAPISSTTNPYGPINPASLNPAPLNVGIPPINTPATNPIVPELTQDQKMAMAAASAGRAANAASTAASVAGNTQEQAQAAAINNASTAAADAAAKAAADAKAKANADAAAAAAGAGRAANAASTAASLEGQKQEQAQATAEQTASTEAAKTAGITPISGEVKPTTPENPTTPAVDDNQWVLDEYKKAATATKADIIRKNYISRIGLYNKAQTDALSMKINSDPSLRGQPAGTALLSMLARDQGSTLSDTMAKLSIDEIDNIQAMNKWGLEGYQSAKTAIQNQKNSDLANLITKINLSKDLGDFESIQDILNNDPVSKGLGINIDLNALKASSPYTVTLWNTTNGAIQDKIKAGDAAGAKLLYDDFRTAHPELKLPDMPAQNFNAQTFDATLARSQDIDEQIRTGILAKNDAKAKEGIDNYFTIGGHDPIEYANALSLSDINSMRAEEGLPAWTANDLIGVDKVDLAKDYKLYSEKLNSKDNTISNLKETILSNPAMKAAYTDPKNKDYIDTFVADLALGNNITIDPTTGRVTIKNGTVNPWEDPVLQYKFKDFPIAQFDASGKLIPGSIAYDGGNFYADASETGTNVNDTRDPSTATGQHNLALSSKYEQYLQTTPKDKVVGMQAWYYGTAGGTKAYDAKNVPGNIDGNPVGLGDGTTPEVITPKVTTLITEIPLIGNSAASVAKWADARKSSEVDLGDGLKGNVTGVTSKGDMDGIVMDVDGKYIEYFPEKNQYHLKNGGDKYYPNILEAFKAAGGIRESDYNAMTDVLNKVEGG